MPLPKNLDGLDPDALRIELEADVCRASFAEFAKRAWSQIDPAPLVWGWHCDAICQHLQGITEGRLRRLVINIPPGHAKSMFVSVLWPAWVWARRPEWKLISSSYGRELATRDATKARTLMEGEWYVSRFRSDASAWKMRDDDNNKTRYVNTRGGERTVISVGSGTGYRGDCLCVDDPMKADDAHSENARADVIRWKTETMSSRFNDMATATEVLIMQRLHEGDLAGYLLANGGWQALVLQTEFDPEKRCITYDVDGREFWRDPRSSEGELLFPAKFSRAVVDEAKGPRGMGSHAFAAQHQQTPVPASGGVIKAEWFNQRWAGPGEAFDPKFNCVRLPNSFVSMAIFVDATFKKTSDSDRVAMGVFGLTPDNKVYMLDMVWRRMGFVETVQALVALREKWPRVGGVYIEDKANGSAIIDTLKNKIPGIIPIEPEGGKEARVFAATPFLESGACVFPLSAPWVSDLQAEACSFPKGAHDDGVDMLAYALVNLCSKNNFNLFTAMSKW